MTAELKVYSVVIAWFDGDPEQGDWGTYVRASDAIEAEMLARLAMRAYYIANEVPEEDNPIDWCAQYDGPEGFGGPIISCNEGAAWLAPQMEAALRALLSEVDEMTARTGWAGTGGRDAARTALAEIDKVEGADAVYAGAAEAAGWRQGGDGDVWWHSSHGGWKNAVSWGRTYSTASEVVESADYPEYQAAEGSDRVSSDQTARRDTKVPRLC